MRVHACIFVSIIFIFSRCYFCISLCSLIAKITHMAWCSFFQNSSLNHHKNFFFRNYSQLQLRLESQNGCTYVHSIKSSRVFIGFLRYRIPNIGFTWGASHTTFWKKKLIWPIFRKKSLKMAQISTFSKYCHVIYRRKAFLMLISDFEFILPDFDFWAQGRESATTLIIFLFTTLLQTAMCAAEVETSVMSMLLYDVDMNIAIPIKIVLQPQCLSTVYLFYENWYGQPWSHN